jgi:hypothetical protein
MVGQRRMLAAAIVVGGALGVVIAGIPSRHHDQVLREVRPAPTTTVQSTRPPHG